MSLIFSEHEGHYLTFDETEHVYSLDGEKIPGVTTINHIGFPESPMLSTWKIKEGSRYTIEQLKQFPQQVNKLPEYLLDEVIKSSSVAHKAAAKEAADIGSLVHDYAEQWESTGKITDELTEKIKNHEDNDKITRCVDKFKAWKDENHDTIIGHEQILASPTYKYGGKYDRLSKRGNSVVLGDFKTSSGIYTGYFVQLAAYTILLKEWCDIDVDIIEIIRFGKKKGDFEVESLKAPKKIEALKNQFLRNLDTFHFIKEFKV